MERAKNMNGMHRFFSGKLACLAIALVMTGCATTAARPSLFERLGGLPAITAVTDKTIDRAASDPRTRRSFEGVKLSAVKASIVSQLCQATGGPCKYEGDTMANAHRGLGITSDEFNALVGQLTQTLDEFKVPQQEKTELIQLLAPMKSDIVTK